jgi:orotidine-5'-phosphate decarboxylase
MWVAVPSDDLAAYDTADIKEIDGVSHTRFYIKQVRDAERFGLAGIVLGDPSSTNHITTKEVGRVGHYSGKLLLKLVPGIGAQGGEVTTLAECFDSRELIANVGRALMFPKGAYSGTEDWVAAARTYRDMLNKLRE